MFGYPNKNCFCVCVCVWCITWRIKLNLENLNQISSIMLRPWEEQSSLALKSWPLSLSKILLYVSYFQLPSSYLESGQIWSRVFDIFLTSPVVATWPVIPILTGNLTSVLLLLKVNIMWKSITNKLHYCAWQNWKLVTRIHWIMCV